jgi:hypothetical protein
MASSTPGASAVGHEPKVTFCVFSGKKALTGAIHLYFWLFKMCRAAATPSIHDIMPFH